MLENRTVLLIEISVVIIAASTLVTSIVVGFEVMKSSEKTNDMLEQSIKILNSTNTIIDTQSELENFKPLIKMEKQGIVLNLLHTDEAFGSTVSGKGYVPLLYKSPHFLDFEILGISWNINYKIDKTFEEHHVPSCVFESSEFFKTHQFENLALYKISRPTLEDIQSIVNYDELLLVDIIYLGNLKYELSEHGYPIHLGEIEYDIQVHNLQTNEYFSEKFVDDIMIFVSLEDLKKIHNCNSPLQEEIIQPIIEINDFIEQISGFRPDF